MTLWKQMSDIGYARKAESALANTTEKTDAMTLEFQQLRVTRAV
jgi:hypothetical protein